MYSIYAKVGTTRVCLHDSTVSSKEVKVIDPTLTLEDSNAGSLTFKIAPNNQAYGTITEYDDMASGFDEVTSNDLKNGFESGTIDDTGNPASSIYNVRTTAMTTIDDGVTTLSSTVSIIPAIHDIASDIIQGSVSDEIAGGAQNPKIVHTATIYRVPTVNANPIFKLDATIVSINKELIDDFEQGSIYTYTENAPDRYTLSCSGKRSSVALTNSPDYFKLLVDPVTTGDKFKYKVYAFTNEESPSQIASTGWIPATGGSNTAVAFPNEGYYRIAISRTDGAPILKSQIAHIYDGVGGALQWRLVFLDYSGQPIGTPSDWFTVDNQNHTVEAANAYGYKVEFRYTTDDDITPSDILTATIKNVGDTVWRAALYSSDNSFIGLSSWLKSNESVSLSSFANAAKFKIVMACKASDTNDYVITYGDVDACLVKQNAIVIKKVAREVDILARMQSIVTVYRKEPYTDPQTGLERFKDIEVWEGRVLEEDKDFYNIRSIYCEGELSYLNDTCQPQREYTDVTLRQFLESVLTYHNSRVSPDKHFQVGQIWVQDTESNGYRYTQYQKTMEVINSLVEQYGGHIKIRKSNGYRYIDWFDDYGEDNNPTQTIDFGKNLLDYTSNWDMTQLCTVLLPTGHVVKEAESTSVGDPLPLNGGAGPTPCQLLTKDENGRVYVQANPNLGGYKTAVAVVEPEKTYYFSGRLHGGLVAYTIKSNADGSGDYFDGGTETAGSESQVGFVDYIDKEIKIPPGAHSVVMCSFGDDIPLALKTQIEAKEGLDTYLTVEECEDDGNWHTKGSLYVVNQEAVNTYGWIEKQMAKEDIEDKDLLYKSAKLYLQDGQFDQMTLEVTAFDMNLLGAKTDFIDLLDQVRVISKPHGVDRYFPVTKLEIPLANPAEQKFTLGTNNSQSLTSVNNDLNADMLNRIAGLPSMSQTLTSAKANAAEMINNALSGFVTMVLDDAGNAMELVISDRQNYKDPSAKVWRWNKNGLGYSDHGYDFNADNVELALTADGHIVADFITTGTMQGVKIQGCEIIAGAMDGRSGKIYVRNTGINDPAIEFDTGAMNFGRYNAAADPPVFTKHSDIRGDISYEASPGVIKYGTRISTPILAFDTEDIWVSTGTAGGDPRAGVNHEFTVIDNNNNHQKITIRRGIIVGVTQVQH